MSVHRDQPGPRVNRTFGSSFCTEVAGFFPFFIIFTIFIQHRYIDRCFEGYVLFRLVLFSAILR